MNKFQIYSNPETAEKRITELEKEVERLRAALEFAKGAIEDAIGLEDGLDGATGESVLKMIEQALETPERV